MSVFIASDGSKIEFASLPTLKSVVELFNLVYEEQVSAGPTATTMLETQIGGSDATCPICHQPHTSWGAAIAARHEDAAAFDSDISFAEQLGQEGAPIIADAPLECRGGDATAGDGGGPSQLPYNYRD